MAFSPYFTDAGGGSMVNLATYGMGGSGPVTFGNGAPAVGGNAYGTRPNLPAPVSTAPAAVSGAVAEGQYVNSQLPGYTNDLASIGGNISAETQGQLPPDVLRLIQQQAAERGTATGTAGSPNNNAAYLQALGLTSLDLTNLGQKNFSSILPGLPGSAISQNPEFYPSSAAATDVNTANAIYRSAPDPAAAAAAAEAAANRGLATGRGSIGGGGVPGGFSSGTFTNGLYTPPAPNSASSTGTGMYFDGQYREAGQGPLSQSDVDRILAQYDPVGQTAGGASESGGESFYNPFSGDNSGNDSGD